LINDGYKFVYQSSPNIVGGISFYILENYPFEIINEYKLHAPGCEELWIELNFNK